MVDPKAIHKLGLPLAHALDDLKDVEISSPANNEVLTYEGATSLWKNKAGGGGGVPSIESGCRVARDSSFQSILTNTWTQVNMDTEYWDIDNEFSLVTNQYVAKKAGYIVATGWVIFKTIGTAKSVIAELRKNGTRFGKAHQNTSYICDMNVAFSGAIDVAVNDVIDLYVWHNHGVARDIKAYMTILQVLKT